MIILLKVKGDVTQVKTQKHKNKIKPNEPIVIGDILKLEPNKNNISLEEDLRSCHCVIAYNSNVALQVTLMGIPVIVGDISPNQLVII